MLSRSLGSLQRLVAAPRPVLQQRTARPVGSPPPVRHNPTTARSPPPRQLGTRQQPQPPHRPVIREQPVKSTLGRPAGAQHRLGTASQKLFLELRQPAMRSCPVLAWNAPAAVGPQRKTGLGNITRASAEAPSACPLAPRLPLPLPEVFTSFSTQQCLRSPSDSESDSSSDGNSSWSGQGCWQGRQQTQQAIRWCGGAAPRLDLSKVFCDVVVQSAGTTTARSLDVPQTPRGRAPFVWWDQHRQPEIRVQAAPASARCHAPPVTELQMAPRAAERRSTSREYVVEVLSSVSAQSLGRAACLGQASPEAAALARELLALSVVTRASSEKPPSPTLLLCAESGCNGNTSLDSISVSSDECAIRARLGKSLVRASEQVPVCSPQLRHVASATKTPHRAKEVFPTPGKCNSRRKRQSPIFVATPLRSSRALPRGLQ